MTNADEWQGQVGQVWARQVFALDRMLSEFGDIGIAALGDLNGRCVLDLGCGAGQSSAKLAAAGAQVTGIDISPDLIKAAQARGIDGARFLHGDAGQADMGGPYDALYSRFGCMFFDDPVGAFSHLRRQVGAECDLSLIVWGPLAQNDWARVPFSLCKDLFPETPAAPAPKVGPFAWGNPDEFAPILAEAGWRDVTWAAHQSRVICALGDGDGLEMGVQFCMTIGALAGRLKGTPKDFRAKIADRLRTGLVSYLRDDKVQFDACIWHIKGKS
ncbi:hypothetical protein BFP76_04805 [Amylibacter kogurei]|uniref:Methyltransferase domain-containing protein n=1 Tax=Paramylibacter kogurei TaxID=1889778 RepID=A0A2G5K747_9RHOB|nr:class I SAM-dependent methyltransferase [Amylibacter kogurei]PIB24524.1 hypothetical protein BFP76_04805 [Amylibacter kogurei]